MNRRIQGDSVIAEFLYHRQLSFRADSPWRLELYGGMRVYQAVTKILSHGSGVMPDGPGVAVVKSFARNIGLNVFEAVTKLAGIAGGIDDLGIVGGVVYVKIQAKQDP